MDSGVHASLHTQCHYQIIFAKFDLKVLHRPPYKRTVWHFSQANFDHIKRAVDLFDWKSALTDLDINEQVFIFNNIITNMSNFIPNKIITCDDRGPPCNFYKTFVSGKKQYVPSFNFLYFIKPFRLIYSESKTKLFM